MIYGMNEELQIKLQALLDGELPEAEAAAMINLIARDAEAAALHAELKNTRQALAKFERPLNVPEAREFYWSKIEREIERAEPRAEPAPRRHALFSFWRRAFAVAGGFAALAAALFIVTTPGKHPIGGAEMEVAMADVTSFTYRNYESGATLVWLSYPAENDVATGQPTTTIQ